MVLVSSATLETLVVIVNCFKRIVTTFGIFLQNFSFKGLAPFYLSNRIDFPSRPEQPELLHVFAVSP